MQEEVEQRTVVLAISGVKLTARMLKAAIAAYLSYKKEKKAEKSRAGPVVPHGKQTVKELVGQDQGVQNVEISDGNIKDFDRVAGKFGIDYAVKKDTTEAAPKYLVFFKARDADAMNAAFREYTADVTGLKKKPSVLQRLHDLDLMRKVPVTEKVRNKEKGLER